MQINGSYSFINKVGLQNSQVNQIKACGVPRFPDVPWTGPIQVKVGSHFLM